jgi:hypothetical protein
MDARPHADDTFIALPGPDENRGQGSRVWAILAADGARERARARRQGLVGVLAVLGMPSWIVAMWPAIVPHEWRSFFAAAWAFAFGGVLLALIGEGIARVRRARQVATLGPLPVLRSARRAAAGSTTAACAAPAEDED